MGCELYKTWMSLEPKTYSSPQELMRRFIGVWIEAFTRSSSQPSRVAAQLTIGAVTAAKLLVRLTNQGGLISTLRPGLEYTIEQTSDRLTETFQKQLEGMGPGTEELFQLFPTIVFGEQDPKAHKVKLLRLVQPGAAWRWIAPPADVRAPIPQDLQDLLEPTGVDVKSIKVAQEIAAILVDSRHKATDKGLEMIAQYCAVFAIAKWSLSLWGNQSRAAAVEYLAEIASAQLYEKVKERRIEKAD